jgi:hypothetical protein
MVGTFVLIVFFWEPSRGYAVTSVPGYRDIETCKLAAAVMGKENPAKTGYGHASGVCVPGPERQQ